MFINPELAAYGMFQVAFAALDTRLSRALTTLCRHKESRLSCGTIRRATFGRRLDMLEKLGKRLGDKLKQPDGSLGATDPDLDELAKACKAARSVRDWRNSAIHAEVMFSGEGAWILTRNGRQIGLDSEECEQRIREAIKAGIAIAALVKYIVAILEDVATFELE